MTKMESRRDMSASRNSNGVMITYLLTVAVAQNLEMLHALNIPWKVDHVEYVSMVRLTDRCFGRLTAVNGRKCVVIDVKYLPFSGCLSFPFVLWCCSWGPWGSDSALAEDASILGVTLWFLGKSCRRLKGRRQGRPERCGRTGQAIILVPRAN